MFAVLLCAIAPCAGCKGSHPPFSLGIASSMVKVPYDRPFVPDTPDTAKISAAGGEYESFQVVICGVTQALSGIRVHVTELHGEKGQISRENIVVNPVGYIQTTAVSEAYPSSAGWWPDPLLRMDQFQVAAGEVQPVWVTVYVPRGTPSGSYRGRVRVSAKGSGWREIQLDLRVWGFDIPQKPSLKTLTWVSPMDDFYGYEKGSPREIETHKRYYDLLLRHRLGPGGNLELSDEMIQYCMDRGLNSFLLAVIPNLKRRNSDSYSEQYKAALTEKLAGCVERFGPRGWLDGMAYVYNYDEVDRDHWPLAKEMYRLVKKVSPQLRVIQCLNIPEGVEALAGYADTWDVYVAQYEKTGVGKRAAQGDEVWLAVCCYPAVRPNLFLEYPALDARILGWICWFTGVSGFEYWSPNHWGKNRENKSSPGLRGGWIANTFRNYNGDGYLVYPGADGSPLGSVRLANLRDGFEDYEYLRLLKDLKGEARIPSDVVSSPTEYSDDPGLIYKTRALIAREIESLQGGKTD